jgi:hypothetical protein
LQHHKELDGRVYVYLDMGETVEDKVRDASRDELVDELRDRVRRLEQDLDTRDRELSEMRRLLAGALERIPELEAAQEPREEPHASETDAGTYEGVDTPTGRGGAETGTQRRSWLRRFFGA